MRRLYRERLVAELRRAKFGTLVRRAAKWAAIRTAPMSRKTLAGPILGTLVTNYGCNLRCRMCDLPARPARYRAEGLRPLDTPELLGVIDDFAALGTVGLGFTGGEPMLRKDLFDLLERSILRGMITHLNTNGSFVDAAAAERLVALGLDSVNLSLDAADPAKHDSIRGHVGSHAEVLVAARRILEARRRAKAETPRLKLVTVLAPDTIDEAERVADLRSDIGADGVDFIPLHDFDPPGSDRERPLPTRLDAETRERIDTVVNRLRARARTEPIENSDRHLALIPGALEGRPSPVRCFAGWNSLVVDLYGRIFPCVPYSDHDRPVGNLSTTPLREFWWSRSYEAERRELSRCRACTLNCQTELNLLFDRGRAGRRTS